MQILKIAFFFPARTSAIEWQRLFPRRLELTLDKGNLRKINHSKKTKTQKKTQKYKNTKKTQKYKNTEIQKYRVLFREMLSKTDCMKINSLYGCFKDPAVNRKIQIICAMVGI